jgi:lipid-binding SYLF domain-containing protein
MSTLVRCKMFLLIIALGLLVPIRGFADTRSKLVEQIERAQEYMKDIMEAPDTAIPESLMRKCKGIIILRQYKAGFVFGAKGGAGIVLVRDEKTREWSPPAFIKTGEGSFGLQIGGQSVDSIFLIMNKDGMKMLNKTKFKIGVDASAAVGPVGRDAEAKVSPGTAILAYSRAKGLYAGAAFEGGLLLSDNTANEKFYNVKNITLQDIVFNKKVNMPDEAKSLVDSLNNYSGLKEK